MREARALRVVASGEQYPMVSASAAYSYQRLSKNAPPYNAFSIPGFPWEFDLYQAGFDASWELDIFGRIRREVRPDRLTKVHEQLSGLADPVAEQVKQLRDVAESLLRQHGKDIIEREFLHKRLADAVSDIYAQVAVLSRVTSILEDQGADLSGQERYIAETFCSRAAGRVASNFRQIEDNDDDRMTALAKLAYRRGDYGYALFED